MKPEAASGFNIAPLKRAFHFKTTKISLHRISPPKQENNPSCAKLCQFAAEGP